MLLILRCRLTRGEPSPRGVIRRLLVVGPESVYAGLENGADMDCLPVGRYFLKMATMATKEMQALWLPSTELFLHPANYPDELKGCLALGHFMTYGVRSSRLAFEHLFASMGGFRENKAVHVDVREIDARSLMNMTRVTALWSAAPKDRSDTPVVMGPPTWEDIEEVKDDYTNPDLGLAEVEETFNVDPADMRTQRRRPSFLPRFHEVDES